MHNDDQIRIYKVTHTEENNTRKAHKGRSRGKDETYSEDDDLLRVEESILKDHLGLSSPLALVIHELSLVVHYPRRDVCHEELPSSVKVKHTCEATVLDE